MTPERLGPPSVEPLSELAWARVERGLWAKLDAEPAAAPTMEPARPSRRWVWIAAPLLAAAAVVAIVVSRPDPTTTAQPHVAEPARYVSGDSSSSISFGNAYVTLEPQTALVVSGPRTLVETGAATFALAPSPVEPTFHVVAGDARVSALRTIETKFVVGRSAEVVTVKVERGMIELTYRGAKTMLRDGDTWTSEPPTPVDVLTPEDTDVHEAAPTVKKAAKATKPAESPRARYERLAALEVKDPAAALAGYLELAKGSSSWAEVSLFAAARLAGDRKDPRARALLKMYLTRFPKGANAADARELLEHLPAR